MATFNKELLGFKSKEIKNKKFILPQQTSWFSRESTKDFEYQFDELSDQKKNINKEKTLLDNIFADRISSKEYVVINKFMFPYEYLRGSSGLIALEYNGQHVSKAWLKMHELMENFVKKYLDKISKEKEKDFYSFHIAEAPGAFIPSINHFIKTHYPEIVWDWRAESYVDIFAARAEDKLFFTDDYGLMTKYENKWIYGAKGDGDITNPANLKWFKHYIYGNFPVLDLITSDVKFVPRLGREYDYGEEENYNIPVQIGHTLCALMCLSEGGCAILKEFTFCEPASISLLYLLVCKFEEVFITKPATSTPANSETYVVCVGMKEKLSEIETDLLCNYLDYTSSLPISKPKPCLFKKADIPAEFFNQILDINKYFIDRQKTFINYSISLYNKYKGKGKYIDTKGVEKYKVVEIIENDSKKFKTDIAKEWIRANKLKKINANLHL